MKKLKMGQFGLCKKILNCDFLNYYNIIEIMTQHHCYFVFVCYILWSCTPTLCYTETIHDVPCLKY